MRGTRRLPATLDLPDAPLDMCYKSNCIRSASEHCTKGSPSRLNLRILSTTYRLSPVACRFVTCGTIRLSDVAAQAIPTH